MEDGRPKIQENRLVDLAYILGISLVIVAIVYFFAANWGGLERELKVGLITLLLISFYGLAFLFIRVVPVRPLVSKLLLFAGVMAFGVSVALLGQLYNSHADSYLLFLIWLIPALLFSLITRLQAFYMLSYILFHLTFAFYLVPSSISFYRSEGEMVLYLIILALLNGCLFVFTKRHSLKSTSLHYVSFAMFHVIWLGLTMREAFGSYTAILNLSYTIILLALLYWFIKVAPARIYIVLSVIALALYASRWILSWMIDDASEWLFLLVILFAITLVIVTIYLLKWMKARMSIQEDTEKPWWQFLLVNVVSAVSSLLATAAFVGLTSLLFNDLLSALYVSIALVILMLVVWQGDRFNDIITNTLTNVGLLLALAFAWDIPIVLSLLFIGLIPFIWKKVNSSFMRMLIHFAANLFIIITAAPYMIHAEQLMLLLVLLNLGGMWVSSLFKNKREKERFQRNALFYSLLFGFVLTFFNDIHPVLYYLYNLGFFLITTYLGFRYVQRHQVVRSRIVMIFWFAFLFYKYYDVIWQLLHKSVTLFIFGFVFLLVAIMLDRREQQTKSKQDLIMKKKIPIVLVILLQLLFIGNQYIQNENVLANGELIKLELEPLDPRSLLQGDYVILQYDISQISELTDRFQPGEKIKLVLSLDENGVYNYSGYYEYKGEFNQAYEPSDEDVLINAKANGWDSFIYGIESYFIEEGTGREVEENATIAFVRVATNGNAMLVELE